MAHHIIEPNPHDAVVPAGAASVGKLIELDEAMQVIVLYMRRWTTSIDQRDCVWKDATDRFGQAKAHRVIGALDIFLQTVANHAKRPIQRHGRRCNCLGEDEAVLAEIVSGAGRQAGPLLRVLCHSLIVPAGFTETISAAVQLYEILSEPSMKPFSTSGFTLH